MEGDAEEKGEQEEVKREEMKELQLE